MMSKNNNEERKCKMCGKTIVGKNKTGICSACKKKAGDTGVTVMGVLALIGGAIWTWVKAFTKKDQSLKPFNYSTLFNYSSDSRF